MDALKAREMVRYWLANRAELDLRPIDEALLVLVNELIEEKN
jgi:hypothetical protein